MKNLIAPKIKTFTNAELLQLIEKAKDAEACRDMEAVRDILYPLWSDIQKMPDFIPYEDSIRAELLRLSGFFLSFYGHSAGKKNYQERGKDLLTNAVELFNNLGQTDKVAEAKIFLALCYWYKGEIEESEIILEDTEIQYRGHPQNDVYLQICFYRILTFAAQHDFVSAAEIVEEMKPLMKGSQNARIQALFHTEAGLGCRRQKKYEEAAKHYHTAIKYARRLNNSGLVATNLNNLAFLYKETGHSQKAHKCIDKAIGINKKQNQIGFLAHKYDTKALIYYDTRDYENALNVIDKAVELFLEGEDYTGLADALFNKARILLRLGRMDEALILFSDLIKTVRVRIGHTAAERYTEKFSKLLYPKRGVGYREEVRLFKKDLVRNALLDSDKVITEAKDKLLISQKGFSEILNKKFPELCDEVGIKRQPSQKKIDPIGLENIELEGFDSSRLITFKIYKEKLPQLKADRDIIVTVMTGKNQILQTDKYFLVQCQIRQVLECGLICKDDALNLFYFENDSNPCPFTSNDVKIIGQIVGYCYADEAMNETVTFRPIS